MIFVERVNKSLDYFLKKSEKNFLIGEDLLDPYGGAFKATKGLSSKYKKQVIATPISESAILGMATGMTFTDSNVVVEIMFSDFLTIISDILINTTSKINLINKKLLKGKIIIRTPNGGRRGYGPIHSQSLEKIFFGFSEINIIALSRLFDPYEIYKNIFSEKNEDKINLILETKIDYSKKIIDEEFLDKNNFKKIVDETEEPIVELFNSNDKNDKTDFLIICYGGVVKEVIDAAINLFVEEELTSKIIVPHKINPIENSLKKKIISNKFNKLVFVEENTTLNSWGSLVISSLVDSNVKNLDFLSKIILLGSKNELISANFEEEKSNLIDSKKIFSKLVRSV